MYVFLEGHFEPLLNNAAKLQLFYHIHQVLVTSCFADLPEF